ncbi:MAG: putative deacylase [Candidatus Endobugula sp.]|jgi:predicted deacylase
MRQAADEHGVKVLLYEAGEALRFDELSIRAGVRGILSVMRKLTMLFATKTVPKSHEPFVARSSGGERATQSGILRSLAPLAAPVKKGDLLGVISDSSALFDPPEDEIKSQYNGIIIGNSNIPLVNEGDAIFHITRFEAIQETAATVEAFQTTAGNRPSPIFDDQTLI